jgi:hypothetical protein
MLRKYVRTWLCPVRQSVGLAANLATPKGQFGVICKKGKAGAAGSPQVSPAGRGRHVRGGFVNCAASAAVFKLWTGTGGLKLGRLQPKSIKPYHLPESDHGSTNHLSITA